MVAAAEQVTTQVAPLLCPFLFDWNLTVMSPEEEIRGRLLFCCFPQYLVL